jgi:ABC-type nitrate/sulfonate/bicarbonate transport system substrate-binding protein
MGKLTKINGSRFLIILFLALACVVCFPGYFALGREQIKETSTHMDEITLKLKWKHQFQFAVYYAAQEKGFYRKAGLRVKIEESSDWTDSTKSVLNGQAEFGVGTSDLVIDHIKGEPIVVLAAIFQHSPLVLLTKQNKGINNIHNLVGKKAMIEPHADSLFAYLKNEGISKEQLVLYPHSFDITPLIKDKVDAISAYTTDEPYILEKNKIQYNIFSPRSAGIDFYGDTLFTTEQYLREHSDISRKFLEASLQGWKYTFKNNKNTQEIINLIYKKYSKRHTLEHLNYESKKMRLDIMPDIVEIGYMYPDRWQGIAETYATLGIIPQNSSLDIGRFIYDKRDKDRLQINSLLIGLVFVVVILVFIGLCGIFRLLTKLNKGKLYTCCKKFVNIIKYIRLK